MLKFGEVVYFALDEIYVCDSMRFAELTSRFEHIQGVEYKVIPVHRGYKLLVPRIEELPEDGQGHENGLLGPPIVGEENPVHPIAVSLCSSHVWASLKSRVISSTFSIFSGAR